MNSQIYWPDVALNKRVELAFACMPRIPFKSYDESFQGRYVKYDDSLSELIRECAKSSALANDPLWSPLLDLCKEKKIKSYPEITVGWSYERAYWINHSEIDPLEYFSIAFENRFIEIKSKEVAGGSGWLSLHPGMVNRVFRMAIHDLPSDFDSWAGDPYPVGGQCQFLLCTDIFSPKNSGLFIDPDTHPNRGQIHFGDRAQEIKQLAAFCRLKPIAYKLLEDSAISKSERESAAKRVLEFRQHSPLRFMPESGFCYRCGRDVSVTLSTTDGDDPTGCPFCGVSWCE